MKKSTEKFNALHQVKTSREELELLLNQAKRENNTEIIYRISKILNDYPTVLNFRINVMQHTGLNAPRHSGSYKEALDHCGRLKKGWKFEKGTVIRVTKKKKIEKSKAQTKKTTKPKSKKVESKSQSQKNKEKKSKTVTKNPKEKNKERPLLKKMKFKQFRDDFFAMVKDINGLHDKLDELSEKITYYKEIENDTYHQKFEKLSDQLEKEVEEKVKFYAKYYEEKEHLFADLIFSGVPNYPQNVKKWLQEKYEKLTGNRASLSDIKPIKKVDKAKPKVDKNGQTALFGALGLPKQLELYTDEFKKMRVTELRKFTLQYYKEHLAGKTTEIRNHLKEVHFINKSGRKIAYGEAMYKEKAVVIEHLEQLIKNSTYNNWGDRKPTDSEEILGYLNFKSKLIIDGVKRHLRIAISVDKYGKKKLKNYDVGKRKTIVPQKGVSPSDGEVQSSFKNKSTKIKPNTQKTAKKHLGSPLMSLIKKNSERPREYYNISNEDINTFLGNVEKKSKESVVITVTGGQGSGKTRFAFQLIDAFGKNYKIGHASIEEHPESSLYINKVHEYLSEKTIANVSVPEVESLSDLDKLIKANDVIIIDSFAKMKEIDKSFEVDKNLRKKYDGKLFIVIFQQTSNGSMRGGTKSQFDADIVLFTEKFDDFSKNYIYIDKNRYQDRNLGDLKYSIYYQKLI